MTFARRPGPLGRFNRRGLGSGGDWRPTQLSGCVLWLRADMGITKDGSNRVSAWADQSGNGHDFAQGTTANQGDLRADAGMPAVYLDGTGTVQYMTRAFTAGLNTTTQTVFFVYKAASSTSYQALGVCRAPGGADNGDWYLNTNTSVYCQLGGLVSLQPCISGIGARRIWHFDHQAFGSSNVRLDGQDLWTGTGVGHAGTAVGHFIGTRSDLFTKTNGWVFEVIQYDRVLTAAERSRVLAYLAARYGVSVAFTPTKFYGLAAWWRADMGVTMDGSNKVSAWADQSGNGRHFLQGTGNQQPTWSATAGPNGTPALVFDETDDSMTAAWALVQPEHVFIVAKMDTSQINPSIFDGGAGTGDRMRLYSTGVGPTYSGTYVTSDGANNVVVVHDPEAAFKTYGCLFNGASSKQSVSGVATVTGNAGTNGGGGIRLNCFGSGGGYAGITTPEAMVYSRALSAAEEAQLRTSYSAGRYGVS